MKPLPLLVIKFFNPLIIPTNGIAAYSELCSPEHQRSARSQRANILRDIDKVFLFFLNTNYHELNEL